MAKKPYLQIEIDEHSADAGVITRCEAFWDSISSRQDITVEKPAVPYRPVLKTCNGRIVYIPAMSDHAYAIAASFRACGMNAEVLERPDGETVRIGRRFVSGKECYPCAITTGSMAKMVMSDRFDPDRSVFFMPSGTGPCRFGQYNVLQRLVLDDLGMHKVPIYAPNQDDSFYEELGIIGKDFSRYAWQGVLYVDLLQKCLHEIRPYEVNHGETDGIYRHYLAGIDRAMKSGNGKIPDLLDNAQADFLAVKLREEQRPLIGIVGEIFVRHNTFANEDVIRKIEALGGQVWLAPVEEWICYINRMGMRKSGIKLQTQGIRPEYIKDFIRNYLTGTVQKRIERQYSSRLAGRFRTIHEPSTAAVLAKASPYIDDSFEGEAVLSMGKAVDFINHGASGIVSIMPFGCMPGTIVSALMKTLKQDFGIPCISNAYDGLEATGSCIQLEAFMHQAHEYMKSGNP